MHLQKVVSKKSIRLFLDFPAKIYSKDPNYIRPLDRDIESIFNKNKNPSFKIGECCRWLLFDDDSLIVGRIAAFFTRRSNGESFGGIGFFECVNSQLAADYMFKYGIEWLKSNGVKSIQGPINFGERMKFWGLLTEGFQEPLYAMNYNPPYYRDLFENYGFQISYKQNCYSIDLKTKLPQKFYSIKNVITSNSSFQLRPFSKNDYKRFAKDFTSVYNKAWSSHKEAEALNEFEVIKLFKAMNPIIDEKIIWFAYYKEEPIAFWINLPNLNDYQKKLNSRLGLLSKLKFLFLNKFVPTKHFVGIAFGIVPEFQNKGIDAYLITSALEVINKKCEYNFYEVQWIGDFNPKMNNLIKHMNGKITRTFVTYEYSLKI